MSAYATLEGRFRRAGLLDAAAGILWWDRAVVMPEGSAGARAEQTAALRLAGREILTAADMADLLDEAAEEPLDGWQAANLREMRRAWVRSAAVPPRLVEARTRANAACEMAWRTARPASDYAAVLPLLEEVAALTVEAGQALSAALDVPPYDALLDGFEPGGRSADIDPVFDDLAAFLPGFTGDAIERQAARPPLRIEGPFPAGRQEALGRRFMAALGFDFDRGRLDVSHHPFTGGAPGDIRITTRYDEADFLTGLYAVLHETGHAQYAAGLPAQWRHQPVGGARGMTLHESQSLLIEMQVCRGAAFMAWAAPLMAEAFGGAGPAWSAENLLALVTRVERGFIRVDADEVTYPAHVILRYRLEKAVLAGDLPLADLPGAWNDGMAALLGIRPPDDRRGCLQDIHWYSGAWGYFPTYTLGAMAAAQLYAAAKVADGAIEPALAGGDFAPLYGWLRPNVHERASRYGTGDLIERATGRPLDAAAFKAHLAARYLDS
ncbi:MAG: carboxypeptidase M32 [Rhodospirillaceae bacterium]|nr:carboxypeptidase M32 [Rhodospirillaceae bacterium]MYB14814.1 carboxypeptidase M32 [Rhodospirillaceae bacterium]MYI48061.1 carboxypeptidase M32 [Rhodospirillaceae bacterium]